MRNRSSALVITNNQKKRMSTELSTGLNEEQKVEKINQFLEERMKTFTSGSKKTVNNDFNLNFAPPKYLDIKKEYITKDEKPILFHDKAKICSSFSKNIVGDIEPYSQHVDFANFLANFKNDEEMEKLEIQDLLNLDYEKIGELKEKAWNYIELASALDNEKDEKDEKDELVTFLCEKLNDIKRNETNIQVFVNNVEKVDSICYSGNKAEVYFSS